MPLPCRILALSLTEGCNFKLTVNILCKSRFEWISWRYFARFYEEDALLRIWHSSPLCRPLSQCSAKIQGFLIGRVWFLLFLMYSLLPKKLVLSNLLPLWRLPGCRWSGPRSRCHPTRLLGGVETYAKVPKSSPLSLESGNRMDECVKMKTEK